MEKNKKRDFKLTNKEKQFLINSFFICGFLSFGILLLIKPTLPNKSSQDIATTISGILGTALGFFGSILVYKALSEQVKANILIQNQFNLQQFESRLYKMLEIYNHNVSNIKYKNRKTGTEYVGKNCFPAFISDYRKLANEIDYYNKKRNVDINKIITNEYREELKNKNSTIEINKWVQLEISYLIFFFGVGITGRPNLKHLLKDKFNRDYLKELLNFLSNKPVIYNSKRKHQKNWKNLIITFKVFNSPNNKNFDKYYNGHQNNLGHYYRHLFMIVKFINDQKMLNYINKWEYSKLLRAQLSNHEQELFFLNSISVLGREWELNKIILDDKALENTRLITKYDLIKNIFKASREKYFIKIFYPNVEFEDNPGETEYRKELEKEIYN